MICTVYLLRVCESTRNWVKRREISLVSEEGKCYYSSVDVDSISFLNGGGK
jgi:hypothetical protein